MPLPLAFMILPIVLHKSTREKLPRSQRKQLTEWIQENVSCKISFSERVISLRNYTQESIAFGLSHEWLSIDSEGKLFSNKTDNTVYRFSTLMNGEVKDCILVFKVFRKVVWHQQVLLIL